MSQLPDTFTLELLGFDRQSPEQASVALASVLGLPPDDAAFYTRRAPVILRAQLPGAEAQKMAKAILDVGGRAACTALTGARSAPAAGCTATGRPSGKRRRCRRSCRWRS